MTEALKATTMRILRKRPGGFRPTARQKREAFVKNIGRCPSCTEFPSGHAVARLSCMIVDWIRDPKLDHLRQLISESSWDSLVAIDEWNPRADVVMLLVLKCPNGAWNLILLYQPFELWVREEILASHPVTAADSDRLGALLTGRWTDL